MKLRDYELDWIQRIRASKSQRVLIVGPTGCGKTVVAVSLIREAIQRHGRVLFLAHRVELINQAKQRLVEHGVEPIDVGTIRAGETENRGARIQVASVQTLARRAKPRSDLVFIDEAHHASSASYRRILAHYPDALVFGLTATPYRLDGKPLGDLFEEIVESAKPSALIEAGWIMRPRVWTVPVDERPDLTDVSMSGGEFNLGELDRAARRKGLVGNIVDHWNRLAESRPTVCYAVSVRHGQQIRDAFNASGVKAELLTGKTNDRTRSAILRRLRTGETSVVVNCMVLTEGWDCPEARCAIVARPTMSRALWFQMAGRVMRPSEVSPIILDHAGNALWHPLPGEDIEHSLSEAQKKPRKPGQMREKVCGDCGSSMPLGCRVCPNCGHEFWTGDPPTEVLGELVETDGKKQTGVCVECGKPNTPRCMRCAVCAGLRKPPPKCRVCGTRVTKRSDVGLCPKCVGISQRKPLPSCGDCGKTLAKGSRSKRPIPTRCRACSNARLNKMRSKAYKESSSVSSL